mgnify:FL=1
MNTVGRALIIAVALGVAMGAASAGTLTGSGATFPEPLYKKWFYTYNKAHTATKINYTGVGSSRGISDIKAKLVDFAGSDAPLTDAELKEMPGRILQIPTCGGSVVLALNVPGVSSLRLSPSSLAGIYLGLITRWNDPKIAADNSGVKLPATPITAVQRSPWAA